jgi:hypothetical protein
VLARVATTDEHVEQGDDGRRERRREQDAAPPRRRIHEREIACPVTALQEEEVDDVQEPAAGDEEELRAAEAGTLDGERDRSRNGEGDDADGAEQPHERERAARALREHVPRRVDEGRSEDEGESGRAHRASLVPTPPVEPRACTAWLVL